MSEHFAIAVEWPDDPRPFLVHLKKPYFVAEARTYANGFLFITTLRTEHVRCFASVLGDLLPEANRFFQQSLGLSTATAHYLNGKHGREFPRYLMARTLSDRIFIVEPDHPSPLVAVTEPAMDSEKPKLSARFDVVTQWRLAQMRNYYRQFTERQRERQCPSLSVPAL